MHFFCSLTSRQSQSPFFVAIKKSQAGLDVFCIVITMVFPFYGVSCFRGTNNEWLRTYNKFYILNFILDLLFCQSSYMFNIIKVGSFWPIIQGLFIKYISLYWTFLAPSTLSARHFFNPPLPLGLNHLCIVAWYLKLMIYHSWLCIHENIYNWKSFISLKLTYIKKTMKMKHKNGF